jgi:hypothetical protein
MSDVSTTGPFRPRFSLLTALLVMALVACGITIWQLWREVGPLRAENRQLRRELGRLIIHDENKIYATQADSPEGDVRRFRVYLPDNKKFYLAQVIGDLPGRAPHANGDVWRASRLTPRAELISPLAGGEYTIEVQVGRESAESDRWILLVRFGTNDTASTGAEMPWMNDRSSWAVTCEPFLGDQIERDPADGIVLFRLRQGSKNAEGGRYARTTSDETMEKPGMMVLIVPDPPSN